MSKQSPVGWAPLSLFSPDSELRLRVSEYYCGWVLMRVSINEKAVTCGLSSTLSLQTLSSDWEWVSITVGEYYCEWVLMSKQSPVGWAPLSLSRLWAQTESEWVLLWVSITASEY